MKKERLLFASAFMTVICILTIVLGVAYAVVDSAVSTALNTSTYTQVLLPKHYADKACVPVAVWTGDETAFYIAADSSGTGEKFIPAGKSYSNSCINVSRDGTALWAKADTGTPTLYTDPGRSNK